MNYTTNILVLLSFYAVLATSLNLLVGAGGLFSVAHAMFLGAGAYTAAVVTVTHDQSWWISLPIGAAVAGVIGVLIAAISLRVSEEYLVIGSFGIQVMGTSLLFGFRDITGGAIGIAGIPLPSIAGRAIVPGWGFVAASWVLAALCIGAMAIVDRSSFGRSLRAVRDDPIGARAIGKNVTAIKVQTFAACSAIAGLVGTAYAMFIGVVTPLQFDIHLSILLLSMIIIGGVGSIRGSLAGATIIVLLPEIVRRLPLSDTLAGPGEQVLYGLILLAVIFTRPTGLFPERGLKNQHGFAR